MYPQVRVIRLLGFRQKKAGNSYKFFGIFFLECVENVQSFIIFLGGFLG